MMDETKFDAWAIVELMGHAVEIGVVTAIYFGGVPMFRVMVPELLADEYIVTEYGAPWYQSPGKYASEYIPARTPLIGMCAIYRINQCSQDEALAELGKLRQYKRTETAESKAADDGIPF